MIFQRIRLRLITDLIRDELVSFSGLGVLVCCLIAARALPASRFDFGNSFNERRLLEAEERWVIPSAPPRRSRVSLPYRAALSQASRDGVGVPEGQRVLFREATTPVTAREMREHTRLHLAHNVPHAEHQHFEQDNALVSLGALKRATSPRRWFGSFPLGLLHERPALNPIVPHDRRDRTGRTCTCYLRE